MRGQEMSETLKTVLERWGFPTAVAICCLYVIRVDILLPLVEEHRIFVKNLGETQKEIAEAINEQTRLLYALQAKAGDKHFDPMPRPN
jgi:hypothetical protein